MNEIVVISGKGGTGKTSITASLASLARDKVVVADCDVDAADLHLLLQPDFASSNDYYSGHSAKIDKNTCLECGACIEACHFGAISSDFVIDEISCEGCAYCEKICPTKSISLVDSHVGHWYKSSTKCDNTLVHARLGIGADNSGKLVAMVKKEARVVAEENNIETIIIDGSPGIGCPVVSSLTGADLVVLVTEPTLSGFHDLKRVYDLVKSFNIKAACIINKADINVELSEQIQLFLEEEGIVHLVNLPYDETFTNAMLEAKTIVEYDNGQLKALIEESWSKIKTLIK